MKLPNGFTSGAWNLAERVLPGTLPAAARVWDRFSVAAAEEASRLGAHVPFLRGRSPGRPFGTRLGFEKAKEFLFANISPPGTRPGTVIAATSKERPNYFYHWARDGALVMDTVVDFFLGSADPAERDRHRAALHDFAFLTRHHQTMKTPSGDEERKANGTTTPNLSDLGEPKFEVDGTAYTGPWGRPQDDGPALRALTFIRFANALLDRGEDEFVKRVLYGAAFPAASVIKADLEHVSNRWQGTSFDLWEESRGHHFYTRLSQRRSLVEGAKLARRLGDADAAEWYEKQIPPLQAELERHFAASDGYVRVTLDRDDGIEWKSSGLDVSVLLAALHAEGDDGYFAPADGRVLATAQRLIEAFRPLYPKLNRDGLAGTVIGRYPEDRFDPENEKARRGNPWVLATAALGELYWRAAGAFKRAGFVEVTSLNAEFFNFALRGSGSDARVTPGQKIDFGTPAFDALLLALTHAGQNQIERIHYHANPDGSLAEQIQRDTGYMHAAMNLTWSYASYLKLLRAKENFLKI